MSTVRTAFIWKESIYKNGFKCSCGNQLASQETGEPLGHVLVDTEMNIIICNKCMKPAACFGEMETELEPGMHGNIYEAFRVNN